MAGQRIASANAAPTSPGSKAKKAQKPTAAKPQLLPKKWAPELYEGWPNYSISPRFP